MEQRNELLCGIPALILGAPSERVFFYVHGKMGRVDGSTTDLNNVKTPGYYFAYSASTEKHFPTTTIGMLEVFLPESYFIQQRYTVYNGSRMYIRGNYGGTWSSWHTVSLTTVT